jgi:hypothetical protein
MSARSYTPSKTRSASGVFATKAMRNTLMSAAHSDQHIDALVDALKKL